MDQRNTIAARYTKLATHRQPFLDRGRLCAKYTIPSLLPPEGHNGHNSLPTPYQSIGARGVTTLAAKLILGLFPPNLPFFRLVMDPKLKNEYDKETLFQVEQALSIMEQDCLTELERRQLRNKAFEALKLAITTGNALLYFGDDFIKVYNLSQYVVRRSGDGSLQEIIIKEVISPDSIEDEAVRAMVLSRQKDCEKNVDLYTRVHIVTDEDGSKPHWEAIQEVAGYIIESSRSVYPLDAPLPWLPIRWTQIDGEDYGRGHVEQYLGDLLSAESLSKSLVQAAMIAAKVIFLVHPNGMTSVRVLDETDSGDIREGRGEDVDVLSLDKYPDMQVARQTLEEVTSRLSFAFLMHTAIQRHAERVTAEEIRYMANELENALGGEYSLLATEFQLPLVKLTLHYLSSRSKLPKLPEDNVRPMITTGFDALGRNALVARINDFVSDAVSQFGPEAIRVLKLNHILSRKAVEMGFEASDFVKTDDELASEVQAAALQSMTEKALPNAVNVVGQAINNPQG